MRLYKTMKQYFLFILLAIWIHSCHGHEHHNHIDPVTAKYSQSTNAIDPLSKHLDVNNVPKSDESDDDSIDARLRAKQDLRNSIHQHDSDDESDRNGSEEDYIKQLNAPLENDLQFQPVPPPIAETPNHTLGQKQPVVSIHNETLTATTIAPEPVQTQPVTPAPITVEIVKPIEIQEEKPIQKKEEEKPVIKPIVDEVKSILEKHNIPQQPIDATPQKIIKEEIVVAAQRETVTVVEPVKQTETAPEPNLTHKQVIQSDPVQPVVAQTIPATPAPPIQPVVVQEEKQSQTPLPVVEPIPTTTIASIVIDPVKIVENIVPENKIEETLTATRTPPRVLRSTTTRFQQKAQAARQRHYRTKNDPENMTDESIPTPVESITAATPIQNIVETTREPEVPVQTPQPAVEITKIPETPVQTRQAVPETTRAPEIPVQTSPPVVESTTAATPVEINKAPEVPVQKPQAVIEPVKPPVVPSIQTPPTLRETIRTPEVPVQTLPPAVEIPTAATPVETTKVSDVPDQKPQTVVEPIKLSEVPIQTPSPVPETIRTPEVPLQTPPPAMEVPTVATPVETTLAPEIVDQTLTPIVEIPSTEDIDYPRQIHVHDTQSLLHAVEEEEQKKEALAEQIENSTTSSSFLGHDHTPHLPRILENDDQPLTTTMMMMTTEADLSSSPTESVTSHVHTSAKDEETNKSAIVNATNSSSNTNETIIPTKLREVCWSLPRSAHPTLDLIENQMLTLVGFLPEFVQTIFFTRLENPEVVINALWFVSICVVCFFFSLFFLTMATNRLRRSHDEKAIRARCQQLQQDYNQLELERATFERQNQKLSDEIDEIKMTPVRDSDEELFELKELYQRLQMENQTFRAEQEGFHREITEKQHLIERYDHEMRKQIETVAQLNQEILQRKDELEKERRIVSQLQTNDLSLERFDKLQETIHELKAEITQLKQEKFRLNDQLKEVQEQTNQLDIEKNEMTIKMKQLKDLVEQRDETITRIREKMSSEREDSNSDFGETQTDENQELLSTIDNDVEKANEHMRQLHNELNEKTRRIKDLDNLLNQEKDRCREMETKLKVVLELRERDAHLHIRQLGQTDAELRKARNDTERVRILQQQLDLKQKQLDDVQKEMENDKTKYTEEFSKLQHDTHEKWMEVKRLTRELEAAKKECEALRRQITRYANNERSSQEKTMLKPVPQHLNNTGRLSSEPETNGSSPPLPPNVSSYQQNENFRPIDHQRNDSGAASPAEMFGPRPPMFGMPRPPFFPPPFLPAPPNPFMMGPRFPMPMAGPMGMISPISHLMTNGSAGGSDANSFEIVDSTNITPNSTSYDAQINGSAVSPTPDDEHQPVTTKTKKVKKTVKKKSKTPTTATNTSTSMTTEDV